MLSVISCHTLLQLVRKSKQTSWHATICALQASHSLFLPARYVSYVGKDFSERRYDALPDSQKPSEERLLDVWQQRKLGDASIEEVQKLLHAAIGSDSARAPGVTDRLLQLFMKIHRVQKDKSNILQLICTDFGFVSESIQLGANNFLDVFFFIR